MKTLRNWLNEYSESHQNPRNKLLHWLCIPQIVFAVFLALKTLPAGDALINPATIAAVLALAYYARLSWQLAIGTALLFGLMYAVILAITGALGSMWSLGLAAAIFVEAWVGQFIGHNIEGARPSFFKDLQFLLIGPLWLLADVYRRMAIPVGKQPAAQS
ncbi:MAG TPA: Mpo1-like protein [Nevskiaceae bacterium]|nr:Mpo1-like protein [Nevskiaceae bacterium]